MRGPNVRSDPREDGVGEDKDRTDEAPEPTEDLGLPTPLSPGRLPPPHLLQPTIDDASSDEHPKNGHS